MRYLGIRTSIFHGIQWHHCIPRCAQERYFVDENENDLNISLDHTVIYSGSVIHHDALPWYSYFNFPWHTMAPLYPSFQFLLCAGDIELNPGPDSDSTRSHQKPTEVKDPTGQILIYFQYVATCQVV